MRVLRRGFLPPRLSPCTGEVISRPAAFPRIPERGVVRPIPYRKKLLRRPTQCSPNRRYHQTRLSECRMLAFFMVQSSSNLGLLVADRPEITPPCSSQSLSLKAVVLAHDLYDSASNVFTMTSTAAVSLPHSAPAQRRRCKRRRPIVCTIGSPLAGRSRAASRSSSGVRQSAPSV